MINYASDEKIEKLHRLSYQAYEEYYKATGQKDKDIIMGIDVASGFLADVVDSLIDSYQADIKKNKIEQLKNKLIKEGIRIERTSLVKKVGKYHHIESFEFHKQHKLTINTFDEKTITLQKEGYRFIDNKSKTISDGEIVMMLKHSINFDVPISIYTVKSLKQHYLSLKEKQKKYTSYIKLFNEILVATNGYVTVDDHKNFRLLKLLPILEIGNKKLYEKIKEMTKTKSWVLRELENIYYNATRRTNGIVLETDILRLYD